MTTAQMESSQNAQRESGPIVLAAAATGLVDFIEAMTARA